MKFNWTMPVVISELVAWPDKGTSWYQIVTVVDVSTHEVRALHTLKSSWKSLKVGNSRDWSQRILTFQEKALRQRKKHFFHKQEHVNFFHWRRVIEINHSSYQPLNFLPYSTLSKQYFTYCLINEQVCFIGFKTRGDSRVF